MPRPWNLHAELIVKDSMIGDPRKIGTPTLPKVALIAGALVLFVYIYHRENQINEFAGCYDCGWDMRQALLLVIGTVFLLFHRIWAGAVSFLAGLKVIYSIGYVTFFNNFMEVHGMWQIVRTSVYWTVEIHPERFIELLMAIVVIVLSIRIIIRRYRRRSAYSIGGIEHVVGPERGSPPL
jgi:hypothetical protein